MIESNNCNSYLCIKENNLYMTFWLKENEPAALLHMGIEPMSNEETEKRFLGIQEIQATGEGRLAPHMGMGMVGTMPGGRMLYVKHEDERNEYGRILKIHTKDEKTGLAGIMNYQFFDGIPVIRCENILRNEGAEPIGLEMVSSFVHHGAADERNDEISLLIPHNSWKQELQWQECSVQQLGSHIFKDKATTSKRIQKHSSGTWSTGEYLPMACIRNKTKKTMEFWQIESNSSWNWELQESNGKLTLILGGPDDVNHHWWKNLKPGQSFVSVPVAIGIVSGGENEAFSVLTDYRRLIRRKNKDNENLPIIFNDYMNCLWADPTTEKELPMIDAASAAGCEYYCIDSGWYTDGNWWPSVGQWISSEIRFPNGLGEVTNYIRSKGMIPGIWLEIEFVGEECSIAKIADKSWFFQNHGKVTVDRQRYHLDFRNPDVRAYTRSVIDRLIKEYGIGYFKIDYNTSAYLGTEYCSDSCGDGLLEHNRAYLSWIDEIFEAYPDLVIENCGSGGMRMDYAMLKRHSIQSISDQVDYIKFASIVVNAPTAVTPEQAAIWSYPMTESTEEAVIFNCVNTCLMRIHQSGNLDAISEKAKSIIRENFDFYRKYRRYIPKCKPFWPLGLAKEGDDWMCLGMQCEERILLAVWRCGGEESQEIVLEKYKGQEISVKTAFPEHDMVCKTTWDMENGVVNVTMPHEKMARIIEISRQNN